MKIPFYNLQRRSTTGASFIERPGNQRLNKMRMELQKDLEHQKRADSLDDRMELQEDPGQQNRVDRLDDRMEAARKRGEAMLQKQKNYWKHRKNMNEQW